MSDVPRLDFDNDMPLTREDQEVMARNCFRHLRPDEWKWEWISLGMQFPNIPRDRPTFEGWEEFEL